MNLLHKNEAKAIAGSLRRIKDNQYEIFYYPISQGRHQLHIKFDSKHLKASPFTVSVGTPIKKFKTPIMTITGLNGPWGVVVNKKGEIIISESRAHCISVERLRSKVG